MNDNTNDVMFKVNRLIKAMEMKVKSWNRRGNDPTLSEVAQSIRTWSSDFAWLSVSTKANIPSFQNARKSIEDAWDSRDDKTKTLRHINETLTYLKGIQKELQNPNFVPMHERTTAKALFGEQASRYGNDPDVFQELWGVRRTIEGIRTTRHQHVDNTSLRNVKSMLDGIIERYPYEDNPMYQRAVQAQRQLGIAERFISEPNKFYGALKSAAEIVDDMGAYADVTYATEDYKPELSNNTEAVKSAMEVVDRIVYAQPFTAPSALLRQAVIKSGKLRNMVGEYYDPKAQRYVDNMVNDFKRALQVSSQRRVKSIGMNGWAVGEVRDPYHSALTWLSRLQTHIEGI